MWLPHISYSVQRQACAFSLLPKLKLFPRLAQQREGGGDSSCPLAASAFRAAGPGVKLLTAAIYYARPRTWNPWVVRVNVSYFLNSDKDSFTWPALGTVRRETSHYSGLFVHRKPQIAEKYNFT